MDESADWIGEEDWEVVLRFLPAGWEDKARELGALRRCRKFSGAEVLLRTLLIHLADGCSLRETAVRARHGDLVSVSDVALLKRLAASGEWFRWMSVALMERWVERQPRAVFGAALRIRVVDASIISEPGATGSTWRLHYATELPSLRCDEVHVTSPKVGESFTRFKVQPGDLMLGDRGYAHRAGIAHVVEAGGAVLVRLNLTNVPLLRPDGKDFALLAKLRGLRGTKLGDWEVCLRHDRGLIAGRVCALKKSRQAAEKARQKVMRENARKGRKVKPETLEAAGYIFVFTTLDRSFGPSAVLELYRGRWQIELVFKRLKSIIGLGHLKKTDPEAAQAWLHGKLLVAFLIEAMISAAERFSPWGYPITEDPQNTALPVARDQSHAPLA